VQNLIDRTVGINVMIGFTPVVRFLVVAAFAQCSVAQVDSGDWVEVARTGEGMFLHLHSKTVVSDGPFRKAWTRTTWEQLQSVAGASYHSVVQVDLYDCKRRTTATRAMQLYEGFLGTGKVVRSIDVEPARLKWTEVPPGTPVDKALNAVCAFQVAP
jgi:hypothetical protein